MFVEVPDRAVRGFIPRPHCLRVPNPRLEHMRVSANVIEVSGDH